MVGCCDACLRLFSQRDLNKRKQPGDEDGETCALGDFVDSVQRTLNGVSTVLPHISARMEIDGHDGHQNFWNT